MVRTSGVDDRTIDSHIKRLRKKFKSSDTEFNQIETLYGVGYRYKRKLIPVAACSAPMTSAEGLAPVRPAACRIRISPTGGCRVPDRWPPVVLASAVRPPEQARARPATPISIDATNAAAPNPISIRRRHPASGAGRCGEGRYDATRAPVELPKPQPPARPAREAVAETPKRARATAAGPSAVSRSAAPSAQPLGVAAYPAHPAAQCHGVGDTRGRPPLPAELSRQPDPVGTRAVEDRGQAVFRRWRQRRRHRSFWAMNGCPETRARPCGAWSMSLRRPARLFSPDGTLIADSFRCPVLAAWSIRLLPPLDLNEGFHLEDGHARP